jgi:hypothetical protein
LSVNFGRNGFTNRLQDFFDLFDLPRSFDVDVKVLANKFKALQRLFHPDLFANRPDKEKGLSETWFALFPRRINSGAVADAGLPDFSWYNIPKLEECTK